MTKHTPGAAKKADNGDQHRLSIAGILVVAAALSSVLYVAYAWSHGLVGFPLDDAWIHQTYGRNLAQTGQLAYLPGQPSAGSTSPAWSLILSAAYMLKVDFYLWTYLIGGLALAATAWFTYRLFLRLGAKGKGLKAALWAGLLCAVEWHLVWASVSGMETILFTALSLGLLEYYIGHVAAVHGPAGEPVSVHKEQTIVRAIGIGLLAGVLVLTRPEGVVLAGLVLLAMVGIPWPSTRDELRLRLAAAGAAVMAMAIILSPYVAFNLNTSGTIFPNTFYAKQAEYQTGLPIWTRLWQVLSPTLAGAQALLLPGFVYGVYHLVSRPEGRRNWPALVPVVWWAAILGLYALRLPVSYQHGRYTMPSIPLLVLYGVWGTTKMLRPRSPRLWVRVVSRAAPVATAILALLFWWRGASIYRDDAGFIEGEMVAVARWLGEHTAPGDLIAVHDIGAIGYLIDRPLLDLAGLITPEVIPFIADADQLAGWMAGRGAAYAVFFPDFSPAYAQLAADPRFEQLHCADHAWTRQVGQRNLCVYRLAGLGD
ncbi:MAG: hypothetical protein JXM73_03705 [Anaerolineae bacterium]|nr:hypothetical protein [Anaerolineae bacterium]